MICRICFKEKEPYRIGLRQCRDCFLAKARKSCHAYAIKNKKRLREYHAKYNRTEKRRKYHRDYYHNVRNIKANRMKLKARRIIRNELERGRLQRGPCKSCNFNGHTDAHHLNYYRPFDIVWLCDPCHRQVHANLRNHYEVGVSPILSK